MATKSMMPKSQRTTNTQSKNEKQYICCRCGQPFKAQRGNFARSQSALYTANDYYVPWCFRCLNEVYVYYRDVEGLGDRKAIRRVCSKIDAYWSQEIYRKIEIVPSNSTNRFSEYIMATNKSGGKYSGRTFDDTIHEEDAATKVEKEKQEQEELWQEVSVDLIDFWGDDLTIPEYEALQKRYDKWVATGKYDETDPAVETLLKQICVTEYDIERGRVDGKPVDKLQSTLNTYLGSLNAKPSQQKETSSGLESMPFGVGIQKWEMTRPIPQPKEEWKDVDGVVKYITTWFIGHLCHMLKIDNKYNSLYEQEVEKYTVNRPQEEYDQDVEDVFDDLFGGDAE